MIKEAYCSFEVSKLLREKGFNEPCGGFYINSSVLSYTLSNANNSKWNEDKSTMGYISAPTHQMAMAWLREVHNILIIIDVRSGTEQESIYCWQLEDKHTGDYIGDIIGECSLYEQACESAIKYCLENLI